MAKKFTLMMEIGGNTEFRRMIDKLNDETDKDIRIGFKSMVFIKMTKWDYEKLLPAEVVGDHEQDWSQFYTELSTKFPNMRYVGIGRNLKDYRTDKILTGGYKHNDPLPPYEFWKAVDYVGVDNVLIDVPQLEATEEVAVDA